MTSTHYVITSSATSTPPTRRSSETIETKLNGHANSTHTLDKKDEQVMTTPAEKPKKPKFRSKYKHVEALHKVARTSVLSHDSEHVPSFLGFRNLMVLTISKFGCKDFEHFTDQLLQSL